MNKLIFYQNGLSLGIFVVGSLFLFLRSERIRERIILASVMLLWAGDYGIRLANHLFTDAPLAGNTFLSPDHLVVGALLVQALIPYAIEVVRPGWINARRMLYLILPWMCLSGYYYGMLRLWNEPIDRLRHFDDLTAHPGAFNVWFRFVLLAMLFGYLLLLNWICIGFHRYSPRHNAGGTVSERMDRSWLRYLAGGMLCVTLAYCCMLFYRQRIWDIVYQSTVHFVFIYTIYKGLFRGEAVTDTLFRYTADGRVALLDRDTRESQESSNEKTFADNLPCFVQSVDNWMNTTQPYLRKDFKLMDMTDILPLNRTYLSRVFNEGAGCSFSQYIRRRRIEKAKEMLLDQPSLAIKEVAKACGFSSASIFNTAFTKETGLPPGLYRRQKRGS